MVMKTKEDAPGKSRRHLSRIFNCTNFSQQSFCKTTSRARRRDILACRRTDIVVLVDERTTLKKTEAISSFSFLDLVIFFLSTYCLL